MPVKNINEDFRRGIHKEHRNLPGKQYTHKGKYNSHKQGCRDRKFIYHPDTFHLPGPEVHGNDRLKRLPYPAEKVLGLSASALVGA